MAIIGYCLAYGTILAKMGRVYQIFHNPTPQKKVLYSNTTTFTCPYRHMTCTHTCTHAHTHTHTHAHTHACTHAHTHTCMHTHTHTHTRHVHTHTQHTHTHTHTHIADCQGLAPDAGHHLHHRGGNTSFVP